MAPFPPRSIDGGIDEIPLGDTGLPGRLFLCGKHVVGPEPDAALARAGATTVVCLNEEHEFAERYPQYLQWLKANAPERAVWFPVPDLHAPSATGMEGLVDDLLRRLTGGEYLLVHCGAGLGRAGTTAVAVLLRCGWPLPDTLAHVRSCRPLAGPEAGPQHELVAAMAELITDVARDR